MTLNTKCPFCGKYHFFNGDCPSEIPAQIRRHSIPSAKQMEDSRKTHYFRDDDGERMVVVTELLPNSEYAAWIDGEGDGVHGLGDTMMEAIADLRNHLVELL